MNTRPFSLFVFASTATLLLTLAHSSTAQDLLPPAPPWKGKSESLVVAPAHPWITPAEKSSFQRTPSHAETMEWLMRLCDSSPLVRMTTIGESASRRAINMVIASADNAFDATTIRSSRKPVILIQAGIHAGEIDGKDAGMMLLRDIVHGKKKHLLDAVNILFIPILNVDGHERTSPHNRVNQRGPSNQGWRTNAMNLNLNRDYGKADSEEITAVLRVINDYDPTLYIDVHVTDGADYQYDVTYGFSGSYSPSVAGWLAKTLTPAVDRRLAAQGHIPGPLVFATNGEDLAEGITDYAYGIRFSNGYGDARHLPAILVENHSLKPFRQRVLGTYVFLEAAIEILAERGDALATAIGEDRKRREDRVTLTWKAAAEKDQVSFLCIESRREKSAVTTSDYVVWTGKPVTRKIPVTKYSQPDVVVARPKAFYVPVRYREVLERLARHGIQTEVPAAGGRKTLRFARFTEYQFSDTPAESRFTVSGSFAGYEKEIEPGAGWVRVPVDQPLGDLAILLLHPESPESFLQWGFFPGIFSRTEYIEGYAAEPLARRMLAEDPALRTAFEEKRRADPAFVADAYKVYEWFYLRSPYVDGAWLHYPVGME